MRKCVVFDFYRVIYNPRERKIEQKVLNIVKKLKEKHIPVYIFTNSSKQGLERINARDSFLQYFDKIVYTERFPKPHKEAFMKLLDEVNLKPSEIVLIDDNPNTVETAWKMGFISIRFTNPADLEETLNEISKNSM